MVSTKKDKRNGDSLGTGRRKSSVARVRIRSGSGKITINGRELDEFFKLVGDQEAVLAPLRETGVKDEVDVIIRVSGGGTTGQSGAIKMGIARALVGHNDELFPVLRDHKFLTRDSRMKERKKYGLHGARRGSQFSKR